MLFDLAGGLLFVVFLFSVLFMYALNDNKLRVAVKSDTRSAAGTALVQRLKQNRSLKVTDSKNPVQDLASGHVDAMIEIPDGDLSIIASASGSNSAYDTELDKAISAARRDIWKELAGEQPSRANPLGYCSIALHPITSSSSYMSTFIMLVIAVVALRVASSISMASQLVWEKEVRSKSLISILIAPTGRTLLVTAKCLTLIVVALISSSVFLCAFALPIAAVSLIAVAFPKASATVFAAMPDAPSQSFWLLSAASLFLLSAFTATSSLALVATVRPKWAPVGLLYFTLAITGFILSAVFANTEQIDISSAFIPVYGLMLMLKASAEGTLQIPQLLAALGSSVLVSCLSGFVALKLIGSERFILQSLDS